MAGPSTPPTGTRFSTATDLALLDGPTSAPGGAITVNPGTDLNTVTQANAAGTTFYLTAGTHTFSSVGAFSQVQPKAGNTYVGAPGAKLDGQNIAQYAFTNQAANVTIRYLEVMNFVCPFDEFVVNHNAGDNWLIEYCQIHHCGGAGVGIGTGTTLQYSWLHHNQQYGFSSYKDPVNDGGTPAITSVTIDHCEVSHCGDMRDEYDPDGTPTYRGRNGGCKFWDTSGIVFTNCWVHHSYGTALWADTNNIQTLVEGNLFEDNGGVAFFYEISYNFRVLNNTFRRNSLIGGLNNNISGDSFPNGAIYLSESGGDSRVGATYAGSTIEGNTFVNNWDDVVLWENSDRFCNSPANTSSKVYKPLGGTASLGVCNNPVAKTWTVTLTSGSPNFTITSGTFEDTDEGRGISGTGIPGGTKIKEPRTSNGFTKGYQSSTSGVMTANATASGSITMTVAAGTITGSPGNYDCRWHTQNVTVQSNTFDHNRTEVLGTRNTANADANVTSGRMAVFSQFGSFPSWSPYQGTTIQNAIVAQGNVWQNNTYRGPYRFLAKDTSNQFAYTTWRAAPYNQDAGSTLTTTPPTGGGGGDLYVPDPPTNVVATAGNASARVAFRPPLDDGGDTLIGYTVTSSPGGIVAHGVTGPITVSGLTNGTSYTFTVKARTSLGVSTASSASSAVSPSAGAAAFGNTTPWQPVKISALRKTTTSAYVSFFAPASTGGAAITGYTATATDAGGATVTGTATRSPITITGLTSGTSYTYTVTATNSVGTGLASQPEPRAVAVTTFVAAGGATGQCAAVAPTIATGGGSSGTGGDVLNTWATAGTTKAAASGVFSTLAGTKTRITGRELGSGAMVQVALQPGDNVQAAVTAAANNTVFTFAPGTYSNLSITPKTGQVFDGGSRAAILDGVNTTQYAFSSSTANRVTVRGFTIKRYNTPLQEGAVHSFGTNGWLIEDNHITLCAASAVATDTNAVVRGNLFDYNGQQGYTAHGAYILYENNEIAFNNFNRAVDMTWEAGGGKSWDTQYATFRNNYVHDNGGNGLWDDTNNIYITYDGNTVVNNTGAGIYHEIGYDAVITNNVVTGNGMASSPGGGENLGWMWDAGIQLRSSRSLNPAVPILIEGNTVSGNYSGVSLLDSPASGATGGGEARYGPCYLANILVRNNTIGMTTGATGVVQDGRGASVFASGLTFTGNHYLVSNLTHPTDGRAFNWFAWADDWHGWAAWQGFGHDATGTFGVG